MQKQTHLIESKTIGVEFNEKILSTPINNIKNSIEYNYDTTGRLTEGAGIIQEYILNSNESVLETLNNHSKYISSILNTIIVENGGVDTLGRMRCFDNSGEDFTFSMRFSKPGDGGYLENDYIETKVSSNKNLQENLYSLCYMVYRLGQYIEQIHNQANLQHPLVWDVEPISSFNIDPDKTRDDVKYKKSN